MSLNAKPKQLSLNILAHAESLEATNTDAGSEFDVLNIADYRYETLWKALSAGTRYLTVKTKNDATNGDMELWAGGAAAAPDDWLAVNATIAQEAVTIKEGTYSAEVTRTGSQAALYRVLDVTLYRGKTVTLSGWINSAFADESRLRIRYVDGSGVSFYSSFHTGGSSFEYLSISGTIPGTATEMQIYLEAGNDVGTIAYFDDVQFSETKYKTADAYSVFNHNFLTTDAAVSLEYSSDNFDTDTNEASASFVFTSNKGYAKAFTSQVANYWRLKIVTASVVPYVGQVMLGSIFTYEKYPRGNFDPQPEKIVAETNKSLAGFPLGTIINYYERMISVSFRLLTPAWVADTFNPEWLHLRQGLPVVWIWDITNHPTEVYYGSVPAKFTRKMPYDPVFRSLNLKLDTIVEEDD